MIGWGPNGYGICGRQYVEILHHMGYKVKVTPVPWMDKTDVLFFLTKTQLDNPIKVWHAIATHPQDCFYTVTEVKKPPDYMAYPLQQAEFIMTQSEFCKESFSRVTEPEKIHVVNFPFIGDIFRPIGPATPFEMDKDYNFKFLFRSKFLHKGHKIKLKICIIDKIRYSFLMWSFFPRNCRHKI